MISHIFFDLHGTLIDSARLHPCYSTRLGEIMAARYGGLPENWSEANRSILADWDSYYTDLNLSGDEGMNHLWEGMYRTTRALFRLTETPEPEHNDLTNLARELAGLVSQKCDALFPEVRPLVEQLHKMGFHLGVTTHIIVTQARGILTGGGIIEYFDAPIIGADSAGQVDKDEGYYRFVVGQTRVAPEHCLIVDDQSLPLRGAKAAGMRTLQVFRGMLKNSPADHILHGDLSGLTTYLKSETMN
jgi:beta-phosphoglucomutase-like phosphatase (HAD superfamily)